MATSGGGFGSFRSLDVEELVRQSEKDYIPPVVTIEEIELPNPLPDFGAECKRELFLLDEVWTFVNHGAFGAANRISFKTAQRWQGYLESQPLRYIDRVLLPQLAYVTRRLASFTKTNACDLALLPNATSGLNAVFQRVPLTHRDSLFLLSLAYGSVKQMAKETCVRTGAAYHEMQVTFKHDSAKVDFVALIEKNLPKNAKVAIFDHVTSNTGIVLPIKEIIELCQKRGCMVIIDGAHGAGQFDLNLVELNADVYISNCHKWLTCPKGVGFLHAKKDAQKWLRPCIVSHGWGKGFVSEFIWQGTSDYSAALSIPSALSLWDALGPDRVRQYSRELLEWAVTMLTGKWDTFTLVPISMTGLMALIALPAKNGIYSDADANYVQDSLHFEHCVEAPIKLIDGRLYVRISTHCYNTKDDYLRLAEAVVTITAQL
eukprot:CFRG2874T1